MNRFVLWAVTCLFALASAQSEALAQGGGKGSSPRPKHRRPIKSRPKVNPVRPKVKPWRPKVKPWRLKVHPVRPKVHPVRPKVNPVRPKVQPVRPKPNKAALINRLKSATATARKQGKGPSKKLYNLNLKHRFGSNNRSALAKLDGDKLQTAIFCLLGGGQMTSEMCVCIRVFLNDQDCPLSRVAIIVIRVELASCEPEETESGTEEGTEEETEGEE
jgi:hypothetical protein